MNFFYAFIVAIPGLLWLGWIGHTLSGPQPSDKERAERSQRRR